MKAVAIFALRNEELYIETVIRHLIRQGIKMAVIDNGSEDKTLEICQRYYPEHVEVILQYPFDGLFRLEKLLEEKERLRRTHDADWIIHHDADEIMQSNVQGETLLEALIRIDRMGFQAVNFDEFVFVYESNTARYEGTDFTETMDWYYFFKPAKPFRIRAFRNDLQVSNVYSAGHLLPLDMIRLYPESLVHRHYISLSRDHAKRKYLSRKFDPAALARKWHWSRVIINEKSLDAPAMTRLKRFDRSQAQLDRSMPYKKHFWQWK